VPPSVEAFHAVERGALAHVAPARAAEMRSRPAVTVVDRSRTEDRHTPSATTMSRIRATLGAGKRAVLLIHRVGDEARAIAARAIKSSGARAPVRLDARSLARDPEAFERACSGADLLVSSPVIAKDLELDGIGCVCAVEADAALAVPEFRAAEEAFATWWRAGRWLAAGDTFVLETAHPRQPAVAALVRWDPAVLLRAESARRAELGYPPFAALVRIDCPPARTRAVGSAIAEVAPDAEVLGPVEREGRSALVVRSADRAGLVAALRPLAARWRAEGTDVRVDVDPREVLP
jgi:primosomal protein N'